MLGNLSLHCDNFIAFGTDANLCNQFCMTWMTSNKNPQGRDHVKWNGANLRQKRAKHAAVSVLEVVQVWCTWTAFLLCIKDCGAAATTMTFLTHVHTRAHTHVIHQGFISECSIADQVHFSPSYHCSKKRVRTLHQPTGAPQTHTTLIPH